MGLARFEMITQSLRGVALALALLLSSAGVAQVSRPTVLQGCQIQLADWTLEIPDNRTVTPRAGDLVIAFVGYGSVASNSNDMACRTHPPVGRNWNYRGRDDRGARNPSGIERTDVDATYRALMPKSELADAA